MNNNVFFDTNILVYAYDTHDPEKQETAKKLLIENIRQERGYVSVQVFGEFFNVVTKRIPQPLSIQQAKKTIEFLSILNTVEIDMSLVHRAIDTHEKYQTSYWDSLVIAAAERANCSTLYSEDMNEEQLYHQIRVKNPFSPMN